MELIENEHVKNITNILEKIGERIEGNLMCDIEPSNWIIEGNISKIKNLQYLCKNKKKITEIGVNACHSLLIMLLENPTADYLLFDLNNHTYTEPTIDYVKKSFPNANIKIIYGDSVKTIGEYIAKNQDELNTYDLCHLDGGHTEDIFSVDYENMKKIMRKDSCVVFDDYNYEEIKKFIGKKLQQNEIKEHNDANVIKNDLHFIYQYV